MNGRHIIIIIITSLFNLMYLLFIRFAFIVFPWVIIYTDDYIFGDEYFSIYYVGINVCCFYIVFDCWP